MFGKKEDDVVEEVVVEPKVEKVKTEASGKVSSVDLFTEGELDYQK